MGSPYPVNFGGGGRAPTFVPFSPPSWGGPSNFANDNAPRFANDNWPKGPTRLPGRFGGLTAAGARMAGRFLGPIGIALTIYDIYTMIQAGREAVPGFMELGAGWHVYKDCDRPPVLGPHSASTSCGIRKNPPWQTGNVYSGSSYWMAYYFDGPYYGPTGYPNGYAWPALALRKFKSSGALNNPGTYHPPVPAQSPAYVPTPADVPAVHIDPFGDIPVNGVVPAIAPIPYPLIPEMRPNPNRSPQEQPQRGPSPAPRPPPTDPDIIFQPGQRPRTQPGQHQQKRPGRRTKERKFVMAISGTSRLGRLLSWAGETADFINAVHDALPKKYQRRGKGVTVQDKAMAIYEHFDKLDVSQAIKNLVLNQIEDMIIGGIGRVGGRANRAAQTSGYLHERPGFMVGPAQ